MFLGGGCGKGFEVNFDFIMQTSLSTRPTICASNPDFIASILNNLYVNLEDDQINQYIFFNWGDFLVFYCCHLSSLPINLTILRKNRYISLNTMKSRGTAADNVSHLLYLQHQLICKRKVKWRYINIIHSLLNEHLCCATPYCSGMRNEILWQLLANKDSLSTFHSKAWLSYRGRTGYRKLHNNDTLEHLMMKNTCTCMSKSSDRHGTWISVKWQEKDYRIICSWHLDEKHRTSTFLTLDYFSNYGQYQ